MSVTLPRTLQTRLRIVRKQGQIRPLAGMLLLGFILACMACSSTQDAHRSERPNIIFLMDDQRRWDALGVENEKVHTPNLDQLAKVGVRFSQAVCQAPMCGPSRTSMMLGLYPNQLGVLRNGQHIPDEKLPIKP
ncbi:MAG: sulfatase-like hydrolase/transferase, partial [Bacteroidota bacterium]